MAASWQIGSPQELVIHNVERFTCARVSRQEVFLNVGVTEARATDATAYSRDDPPALRRLDSTKRYPRDIVKEVHADGEIWSACLWQIREAVGRARTDTLVLAHHFLIRRAANFENAAEALIVADRQMNGGANEATIRGIFVRRGILQPAKRKRGGYDPFARNNRRSEPGHA